MNPKDTDPKSRPTSGLEENLKKALTELLILFLFGEGEHYIGELSPLLETRSHGTLSIVFPYAAIYRITAAGYLTESEKKDRPRRAAAAVLRHHPGGPGPSAGDAGHLPPVFPGCQ